MVEEERDADFEGARVTERVTEMVKVSLYVGVGNAFVGEKRGERDVLGENEGTEADARAETEGLSVEETVVVLLEVTLGEPEPLRVPEGQEEAEVESVRVEEATSEKLCVRVVLVVPLMRGDTLMEMVVEPVRVMLGLAEGVPVMDSVPVLEGDAEALEAPDAVRETLAVRDTDVVNVGLLVCLLERLKTLGLELRVVVRVTLSVELRLPEGELVEVGETVMVRVGLAVPQVVPDPLGLVAPLVVKEVVLEPLRLSVGLTVPVADTRGVEDKHTVLVGETPELWLLKPEADSVYEVDEVVQAEARPVTLGLAELDIHLLARAEALAEPEAPLLLETMAEAVKVSTLEMLLAMEAERREV